MAVKLKKINDPIFSAEIYLMIANYKDMIECHLVAN